MGITGQCSNLAPSGFAFNEDGCNHCKFHLGDGKCSLGPEESWDKLPEQKYKEVNVPINIAGAQYHWED